MSTTRHRFVRRHRRRARSGTRDRRDGSPGTATWSSSIPARPPTAGSARRPGSPASPATRATSPWPSRPPLAPADLAPLRGWVNNAAVFRDVDLHSAPAEDVADLVLANLRLAVTGCAAAVRAFLDAGTPGAIVNVSSHQAQRAVPGALAYATAKAAVEGLTRAVAVDYAAERDPVQRGGARLDRHGAVRRDAGGASRGRRRARASAPARATGTARRGGGRRRGPAVGRDVVRHRCRAPRRRRTVRARRRPEARNVIRTGRQATRTYDVVGGSEAGDQPDDDREDRRARPGPASSRT